MISVLETPLFRARKTDGTEEWLGLKALLLNAHLLMDISGRTPTGRIALLRHLIAFASAAFGLETVKRRHNLLQQGFFDAETIDRYIALCERDGPCFDLDDPTHPYMQAPYDEALDLKAERPVAALFMDLPTGNNHIFLDHRQTAEYEADLSEAFEAMLETYLFCPAGLAGPSGVNNTPPCYALALGENLFETLVLNMVSAKELLNIPFGAGDEPWRSRVKVVPGQSVVSVSYLKALTWQPRRICLKIEKDHKVRRVFCQAGLDFRGDGRWMDPNVPYRKTKEGVHASLKPESGRSFWRDAALLAADAAEKCRPPVTLSNLSEVLDDDGDGNALVEAVGLITNQAACVGWLDESLKLPEAMLRDPLRAEEFRAWIRFSESINLYLRKEVHKRFGEQAAAQASQVFLQRMYEGIFGALVRRAADEPVEGTMRLARQSAYAETVLRSLGTALHTVVDVCGTTVDAMKHQEALRGRLMGGCRKSLREEGFC